MENVVKDYTGGNVCILSDWQAAMKAFDSSYINSKLVWDCHQSMMKLAKHNRIQQVRVPGHMGVDGNEIAGQLTWQGSSYPLTGPELAFCMSAAVDGQGIRGWMSR
jgi:ribonuclease HI